MKSERWAQHIRAIALNPASYGFKECTLCGREQIAGVGVCFPYGKLAKALKQPKNKNRTLIYTLCEECSKMPDAVDQIEQRAMDDLAKGVKIPLIPEDYEP